MTRGPGGLLALTRQRAFTSNLLPALPGALGGGLSSLGNLSLNVQVDANGNAILGEDGRPMQNANAGKVLLQGADVSAAGNTALAGDELTVTGLIEIDHQHTETQKTGFLGLRSSASGRTSTEQFLDGSVVETDSNLTLLSDGNAVIEGSDVNVGGDFDADITGDLLITAQATRNSESSFKSESGFSLDPSAIYQSERNESGTESTTWNASTINVGGDTDVTAASVTLAASTIAGTGDVDVKSENGDIDIIHLENTTSTFEESKTTTVSLGDSLKTLLDVKEHWDNLREGGELSLAKADYEAALAAANAQRRHMSMT